MANELKIEYLPVGSLKPYEKNAKKHPAEQVEHIANSIREFGFRQPLVIDKDNVLVIGHGRLLAAKELGLDTVPCVRTDDLTEEQIKALRLADNKTNESEWDFDLLDMELSDITDIEMGDFGFSFEEDENYGTDFSLPDGNKEPVQNMTFTFSDDEAEAVKNAIAEMKKSETFERYNNPLNENGNGKALYLVVSEWQAQRT